MKSFVTFIVVGFLGIAVAEGRKDCPMKKALEKSVEACMDKLTQADKDLIEADEYADNENIRCFRACIMNHAGLLEENNIKLEKVRELIEENVKEEAEANVMMGVINICKEEAEVGENECHIAGLFFKCFVEKAERAAEKE